MTVDSQFDTLNNVYKLGNLEQTSASWTQISNPPNLVRGGSYIRFEKDKILLTGGLPKESEGKVALPDAEVITLNPNTGNVLAINMTNPMFAAREEHNLTVLPDGTVLATGGYSQEDDNGETFTDCQFGVFTTELWNPSNGLWQVLASMTHRTEPVPRMYHSTAALMPDGRVLSAGGECTDLSTPNPFDGCPEGHGLKWCMSADYYEPPYLFRPDGLIITDNQRPDSSNPLQSVAFGEAALTFPVTQGSFGIGIDKVSLIRPTSLSHSNHMNARFASVDFLMTSGQDSVLVPTFPDATITPPGYYMLFLVNVLGRPSHADFVLFWELIDSTVSHTLTVNPNGTFQLDVTWKTTGPAKVGDNLVLVPPPDGSVSGSYSGGPSADGTTHTRTFVGTCYPGKWFYTVDSKAPRYATGPLSSVSTSTMRNFRINNCLDDPGF